jgi:hypothetical protein
MEIPIEIYCCLCREKYQTKTQIPDEWGMRYDHIDKEDGFCPHHKIIEKFANNQCPGCVGGWMDCSLWGDFAYSGRRNLTDADFETMKKGFCPRRTGGTLSVINKPGNFQMQRIDLSTVAPVASGQALAKAIRDYWERR